MVHHYYIGVAVYGLLSSDCLDILHSGVLGTPDQNSESYNTIQILVQIHSSYKHLKPICNCVLPAIIPASIQLSYILLYRNKATAMACNYASCPSPSYQFVISSYIPISSTPESSRKIQQFAHQLISF